MKRLLIVLSLASIACSVTVTPASIATPRPSEPRRDYHALYDNRPAINTPILAGKGKVAP